MDKTKVSILGIEYTIRFDTEENNKLLESRYGYLDPSVKEIVLIDFKSLDYEIKNPENLIDKVVRHEIIHAFIRESGFSGFDDMNDEQITDWFAYQFPKIKKVFEELEVG